MIAYILNFSPVQNFTRYINQKIYIKQKAWHNLFSLHIHGIIELLDKGTPNIIFPPQDNKSQLQQLLLWLHSFKNWRTPPFEINLNKDSNEDDHNAIGIILINEIQNPTELGPKNVHQVQNSHSNEESEEKITLSNTKIGPFGKWEVISISIPKSQLHIIESIPYEEILFMDLDPIRFSNLFLARIPASLKESWDHLFSNCEQSSLVIDEKSAEKIALMRFSESIHSTCDESLIQIGSTPSSKDAVVDNEEENIEGEDFPIGRFMRFLRHLKLHKILSKLKDNRDPKKIEYTKQVLLQWALSVFFFRRGSLNSLHKSFERLPAYRKRALWKYFDLPDNHSLPDRTVVTDFLSHVNIEEINAIFLCLFKSCVEKKLFYNYANQLLPDNKLHIAIDGCWFHKYSHAHTSKDRHGNNIDCPYCLPRVYNKGKENERIEYLHACVNFCILAPEGVQLPLYVHILRAEQVQGKESASFEDHKQECELQAAKLVLPLLKKWLSKWNIRILTDSLYANEPFLKLLNELGWNYLITRQTGSLKKLARQCDDLEKTSIYQQLYQDTETINTKDGGRIERCVKWFNQVLVGETYTNVLRFEEIYYDKEGKIIKRADGKEKRLKTEWLSSTPITSNNWKHLVKMARMRADHEDLHNTLKNRGYNIKHAYARANPNAWAAWTILAFIGFWIFELFSFTRFVRNAKKGISWKDFTQDLFNDLIKVPWEILAQSPSLQQEDLQFRYDFIRKIA